MARPGGLGRGLGALIPTGVVSNDEVGLQDIPTVRHPAESATTARALRRGVARVARGVDPRGRCAPADPRPRRGRRIRADRRRAPLACGAPHRAPDHPCHRPHRGRRLDAPAGDRRERAARGAEPARGSRRVPAADRGLLAHPRRRRRSGRQEPHHHHEHVEASAAPARDPASAQGGRAADGSRRARCSGLPTARSRSSSPSARLPRTSRSARSRKPFACARTRIPRSRPRSRATQASPARAARARGAPRRLPRDAGRHHRWVRVEVGWRSSSQPSRTSSGSTASSPRVAARRPEGTARDRHRGDSSTASG